MISGNSEIQDALVEIEPFGSYLRVLPGGSIPPNPSEMLGSARMSTILAELSEMSDLVLIDTAPVLVVSDAFPLFEQVAGIVGVSRLEQTPREAITRAIEVASSAGGRVLGMVATGAKQAGDGYGYGYGYGETPSAAADPHFLAASGGGQTTGQPVTRRSGSSSGPADLRALPEQKREQRLRAAGPRARAGSVRAAVPGGSSAARDAGRQLLGGLSGPRSLRARSVRPGRSPCRRPRAVGRPCLPPPFPPGGSMPTPNGMFAPSRWFGRARRVGASLHERDRVLLARRAARVVVHPGIDLRGRCRRAAASAAAAQRTEQRDFRHSAWSSQTRGLADNMPLTRTRILLILARARWCSRSRSSADAAPSRKKSIWGPATVNGRSQFPIYRDLGVGIWQNRINWSDVAPTRPAHPRDPLDPAYQLAGRARRRDRGGQALRHPDVARR